MELIKNIQDKIQAIYGVAVSERADDYLIGREQVLELLPSDRASTILPRELFLVNPTPENDTLEIALFFSDDLRANLHANDPMERLTGENISDFCTLIEGVSHFVYYLHKAGLEHEVTQLELELQAEIDKFVLLSFSVEAPAYDKRALLELLFEDYSLHAGMDAEAAKRYHTASQLARKYCYDLLNSLRASDPRDIIQQIRSFYPLRQEQKIQYIMM